MNMIAKFDNVSKSYQTKEIKKIILNNVSFTLENNNIYGLIGLNGAGKSTIIKLLTGILLPDSGNIFLLDHSTKNIKKDVFNHVSVLFGQRSLLWWDLPVINSFEIYQAMYNINKKEYTSQLFYLTQQLDLNDLLHKSVRTLSLGQRTLCNIALSLIMKPSFIIYDEPTIGLDFLTRKRIRSFIQQYQKDNQACFLITSHDLEDIKMCNHMLLLDKGCIQYDGLLSDFITLSNSDELIYELTLNPSISSFNIPYINKKDNVYSLTQKQLQNNYEKIFEMIKNQSILHFTKKENTLEQILEKYYEKI